MPCTFATMDLLRTLTLVVLAAGVACGLGAAEEPAETPRTNMKSLLRARIAEDAKKAEAKPGDPKKGSPVPTASTAAAPAAPGATDASGPATATVAPITPTAVSTPAASRKDAAKEPATVLPKVEVKKNRITVLDQQLAKQEQDIARERKNLKASEVDLALNDAKIAQPLAIFGGESSQFRQRVASERVQLMEAEKDILEAIARARTKEEKAELQKQLDEIRRFRRELDQTLR